MCTTKLRANCQGAGIGCRALLSVKLLDCRHSESQLSASNSSASSVRLLDLEYYAGQRQARPRRPAQYSVPLQGVGGAGAEKHGAALF